MLARVKDQGKWLKIKKKQKNKTYVTSRTVSEGVTYI